MGLQNRFMRTRRNQIAKFVSIKARASFEDHEEDLMVNIEKEKQTAMTIDGDEEEGATAS